MRAADQAGAWLVQNPRSNEGNRVGYPRALWASGRVALGTDGYPADMQAEATALRRLARGHEEEEKHHGERVQARQGGGLHLLAERFGHGVYGDQVTRAGDGAVVQVVVAGQVVVKDGALVHGDMAEIRATAAAQAGPLFARMSAL